MTVRRAESFCLAYDTGMKKLTSMTGNLKSSATPRSEKGSPYSSSFPRFRLKIRALISRDRSGVRTSIPEICIPSNEVNSNVSQSISNGKRIKNSPRLMKSETDSDGYGSPVNRSECNLSSGTASNLSDKIQTPRHENFKDFLSDSQPTCSRRNSVLHKVVRAVIRMEEDLSEDPKEDLREDPKEDFKEDPKEDFKEDLPKPFYRASSQAGSFQTVIPIKLPSLNIRRSFRQW
ncbi:hypothetical protein DFH28DRAFT_926238 [Melampsora americana]|nr:hypothetical protein DFH28DRAFT_926238 [Melampsora americana]